MDLGLASFTNVNEYLFVRCGTPGFVAPEIINMSDKKGNNFYLYFIIYYYIRKIHRQMRYFQCGSDFPYFVKIKKLNKILF